jgi:hypothetical protein
MADIPTEQQAMNQPQAQTGSVTHDEGSNGSEAEQKVAEAGKPSETVQDRVDQGEWADCWICADVFRRRTQTKRHCARCRRGFCEGWHGSLDRGYGTCVICWASTDLG